MDGFPVAVQVAVQVAVAVRLGVVFNCAAVPAG